MANIVRTPTKATGGITDAEREAMADHVKLWVCRAMRTTPVDHDEITAAVHDLYAAAALKKPRVVIAPSPLVMAFAFGAATVLWARSTHAATYAATEAATRAAIRAATDAATYAATEAATRAAIRAATDAATYAAIDAATHVATHAATRAATRAATDAATYAAIRAATDAATRAATEAATHVATHAATRAATYAAIDAATHVATEAATHAATHVATRAATYAATEAATRAAIRAATDAATRAAIRAATDAATYAAIRAATDAATQAAAMACHDLAGRTGLDAVAQWHAAYQGGAYWAGYECYLTAMRDIIGLRLPEHAKYAAWERCAIAAPFRVMHPEFCIVSDFPEVLRVDDQQRPHCETGPSHRWRDGWALYHWHGVRIPGEWIEDRPSLDAKTALTWPNIEQRRAACEIVGWHNILKQLKAKTIDRHPNPQIGELVEVTLPDAGKERFLCVVCGTGRRFSLPVPKSVKTAIEAQAWSYGLDPNEFQQPEVRT